MRYDCHCGARFKSVCRFRHWLNNNSHFSSGTRAFLIGITFLTFASGAPNRLNGCGKISEEVEQRHEMVESVQRYNEQP